jgi:hypothetical protein
MRLNGFKLRIRRICLTGIAGLFTTLASDSLLAQSIQRGSEITAVEFDTAVQGAQAGDEPLAVPLAVPVAPVDPDEPPLTVDSDLPGIVADQPGYVGESYFSGEPAYFDGQGGMGYCGDDEQWYLFRQCEDRWNIRGWMNAGIMFNTDSPASRFNGPYNSIDRSNEAMFNQAYIIAEKKLARCCNGWGGRVDYLFGEDFLVAQSVGMELHDDGTSKWNSEFYGSAIPQAYINYGSQELNVQVGHFYTLVGYEGVMAPDNVFYSKSYSYQFGGPFTHWGGMVNWSPNQRWTFNVGLTNGWNALDRENDTVGLLARARFVGDCGVWTSFAITTGQEFNNPAGLQIAPSWGNRTRYSWLIGIPLTCRMDYVFHQYVGTQEGGAINGGRADWFGIDQYLGYTINECWKAAMRFEWFNDEDGTRVGLNRPSNPNKPPLAGDYMSLTFGLNWTPTNNFTFRPEVRYDWFDGAAGVNPFNDGLATNQFTLGFDAIMKF